MERVGLISRDPENAYLNEDMLKEHDNAEQQSHSISYRISIGPKKSQKIAALKTLPPCIEDGNDYLGAVDGFSLHAGVSIKANHRDKLERICRYIARPAVSLERISITGEGKISYELKTPYRDGTTEVIFEPLDFISKLCALIPTPNVNLVRYHGVFGPNSRYRGSIIKQRGVRSSKVNKSKQKRPDILAMKWSERLKRAFKIDIEKCEYCGHTLKIMAIITQRLVIDKTLQYLKFTDKGHCPLPRPPPL